jgi:DNA repair protein SbcC/Rad50
MLGGTGVIPQRISLKGFLCYKDEQVVDFTGPSTLWMLSGLNGSGKSAIFDAVTFALFGCHRGGSQRAVELINKESRELIVEFDFGLDGKRYRARRTQKRDARGGAKGTQQLFRLDPDKPEPVPIEDTQLLRNFDAWVGDSIGLDYETFTSSVLLLQGKAEKLLDSKPEGRREVLAGIVDLKRYEALHAKADQQRRSREADLKALSNRLAALPPVAPLELAAAANRISAASETRENAQAEVQRFQRLELQAQSWGDLQDRLGQARESCRHAQGLLDARADIERAMNRLRELREVLPHLETVVRQRGELGQAAKLIEELERERLKRKEDLVRKEDALKQARDKQKLTAGRVAEQETRLREAAEGYRRSSERMVKLTEYERQEAELGRVREELKRLPEDPADVVRQHREAYDVLTAVHQAVPVLSRFRTLRDDLGRALERERDADAAHKKLRTIGEGLRAELDALRPRVEEAARDLEHANERAAGTRSLLQQARDSLKEADELHGAKVCRHCGQELKPGHVEDEKRRRARAVAEAEKRSKDADAARAEARAAEKKLRDELNDVEKRLTETREQYGAGKVQLAEAQRETQRLQADLAAAFEELTPTFRKRIAPLRPADWLATAYPEADELTALRGQAAALSATRVNLERAERQQREAMVLRSRENGCLEAMRRLQAELPPDRAGVRAEHDRLEVEKRTLEQTLEARRTELRNIDADLERLGREREQAQRALIDVEGRITKQELTRDSADQAIEAAKLRLPPAWQEAAEEVGLRRLSEWQAEREELERGGTEMRSKELQDARVKLDAHRREVAALEAQQAAFPAEAREHPDRVRERLAEARRVERSCDTELMSARQEAAALDARQRQRAEIEQEYLNAEREHAAESLLAELLGKGRLQLYLVRQAERQVVEYANAVLDRLSGGTLCLRLAGEAGVDGVAAKALELEVYNRVTGEKPINVAFLSGSQKFRVAVSLALGIGQYASRRHRPIESVIIDEGFGCLDRQGRQVMIQELQNLRSQMRCILLVSHQEEFADAFSDGYHFELHGGSTKVTRVQK